MADDESSIDASDVVESRATRSRNTKKDSPDLALNAEDSEQTTRVTRSTEKDTNWYRVREDAKICVGPDHQVTIPDELPKDQVQYDRTFCDKIYDPSFSEAHPRELDDYVLMVEKKIGANLDQALVTLHQCNYNVSKALTTLEKMNFNLDHWTDTEKARFEHALNFHGKNFHRIFNSMETKTIPQLVAYYYNTKKERNRISYIEKERLENAAIGVEQDYTALDKWYQRMTEMDEKSDIKKFADSEDSEKKKRAERIISLRALVSGEGQMCSNCHRLCGCPNTIDDKDGFFCNACYLYYQINDKDRPPEDIAEDYFEPVDQKAKTPAKVDIDLAMFATYLAPNASTDSKDDTMPDYKGETIHSEFQARLKACEKRIQAKKQEKEKREEEIRKYVRDMSADHVQHLMYNITTNWSASDKLMAVQCFRKCGKDTQLIADLMGTKTKDQIDAFYDMFKTQYQLEKLIAEYESEVSIEEKDLAKDSPEHLEAAVGAAQLDYDEEMIQL